MTVLRPMTPREALAAYADAPDALPLAGGTDLMVTWNLGELNHRTVLDLSEMHEWRRIELFPDTLKVGSMVTHTTIQRHATLAWRLGLLAQACATVGGVQIQNRGTLGGNVANASPAGDTLPPLAVYDARVHVGSAAGRRVVPFLDLFAGVKETTLRRGELIETIELPLPPRAPDRQTFRKVGTRAAQAISKTVFAGALWLAPDGTVEDVRLALGSMAPTVRRLRRVEAALTGKRPTPPIVREAVSLMAEDVSPIDDVRSTASYRLIASENVVEAFLADASPPGD